MPYTLTTLSDLPSAGFDDVIDARSPAEFAEDHLPGAVSLPVLSNEERADVGTMYVQVDRFGARRLGAALVLRNISDHLEMTLADKPGGWRPLIYCWRGGQRSGTFGWLLREIGWRAETLEGGYQSFRRLVVSDLYEQPLAHRFVVLAGMTCTAKTALLHRLQAAGMQMLDLEGLARHRGSVFGGWADPQPGQKAFETAIATTLAGFDPARPVVVEAESSKVGDLIVPPSVWKAMCAAPRVEVSAPLAARAAFFPAAYPDLVGNPGVFSDIVGRLRRLHGAEQIAAWQAQIAGGDFEGVAAGLIAAHYDPRYAKSQARFAHNLVGQLHLDQLDPAALDAATAPLAEKLQAAATAG